MPAELVELDNALTADVAAAVGVYSLLTFRVLGTASIVELDNALTADVAAAVGARN